MNRSESFCCQCQGRRFSYRRESKDGCRRSTEAPEVSDNFRPGDEQQHYHVCCAYEDESLREVGQLYVFINRPDCRRICFGNDVGKVIF